MMIDDDVEMEGLVMLTKIAQKHMQGGFPFFRHWSSHGEIK